jgi:exopolysaccharide biosynthesis polyprenyl glycosylphosphotransferase
MKKAELVFNVLLVPVDFLMVFLSGMAAYFLRFSKSIVDLRPILFDLPLSRYTLIVIAVALFFVGIFSLLGLYSFVAKRKIREDFSKIVIGVSAGIMLMIFFTFLTRELFSSRFIILALWILAIVFVFAGRIILEMARRWLVGKYGYGTHKVFIMGENDLSAVLKREFQNNPALGYRVLSAKKAYDLGYFKKTYEAAGIDEVIVTDLSGDKSFFINLLEYCRVAHIDFKFVADLFHAKATRMEIETIGGVSLIEIKRTPMEGWGRVLKRVFDILGAVFGVIIFSPIMIVAAVLIKLDSRGPALYYSERVGVNGHFNVLKFRSMKAEFCTGKQFGVQDYYALKYEKKLIKEKNIRQGAIYKIKDDPRITRLGRFLRRASIDELPQLFNVLAGHMSLVGPRPHQPREVLKNDNDSYKGILQVKPGITGLAQVSGRSDLSTEEELNLDTYYAENWSIMLDIIILIKTIPAVVNRRRAE